MSRSEPVSDVPTGSAPVALIAAALAVLGGLFAEGVLVAAVALLGGPLAFVLAASACSAASILIAWAFDAEENRVGAIPLVARLRNWIRTRQAEATRRAERVAHLAWWLGFAVLSLTVGPFLTTVAVKVRGTSASRAYRLAVVSSVLFSAVWVAVYSGGIAALRALF